MVKSSLGDEVYALSEMVGHMLLLKDFHEPFEDCESLFIHHKTKKNTWMIDEKYLVRHLASTQ